MFAQRLRNCNNFLERFNVHMYWQLPWGRRKRGFQQCQSTRSSVLHELHDFSELSGSMPAATFAGIYLFIRQQKRFVISQCVSRGIVLSDTKMTSHHKRACMTTFECWLVVHTKWMQYAFTVLATKHQANCVAFCPRVIDVCCRHRYIPYTFCIQNKKAYRLCIKTLQEHAFLFRVGYIEVLRENTKVEQLKLIV